MLIRPLIIAHRGASGEAPENTLAAFQLAMDQGCDAIELDIHLSADGNIIVCHDSTINRTTSGTGHISDMTLEELKGVDAGSWYSEKYAGEQIPLLEEVFDMIPNEMMIHVEIKDPRQHLIVPKLSELLKKNNRLNTVVALSFHHKSLLRLKQIEQEVKISPLYRADFVDHRIVAESLGVPVYSIHPNFRFIHREDILEALNENLQVYLCTINDEKNMKLAMESGASGILTDFPKRLQQVLKEVIQEG